MRSFQAPSVSLRRKGITAVLAGIMLFAMIFTIGLGYFAYVNVNEGIQGQANASAQSANIAAGQEKLTLTANTCANAAVCDIWLSAKNIGGTPATIVSVFVTNSAGQLVSTGPTSPYLTGPSGGHQYLNLSLPLTIPIGSSTHTMSGCSSTAPVGCDIAIGLAPYGFTYSLGTVLVTALTANGNKFSAQYPPPVTTISTTSTTNNAGPGVTYAPTTTSTQIVHSSTSTSTTVTTSTTCSLCTTSTSPGASAPSLSVTLLATCLTLCGLGYVSYGGTFSVTASVSVAQNSEAVNNVQLYLTPTAGMPSGGAYAAAVSPQLASCAASNNISPLAPPTSYQCNFYGYWVGQGGQITFAGYAVGTGAVDGVTITSAEATSNPIQVGSFTSVGPFSVNVLSYSFTSVQNQGGLAADAIGICSSTSACENKDVAYYIQLTNTLAQPATILGYSFIESFRPGSDYEYFQVGGVTYTGNSGTITPYPASATCTSPPVSGNTVSATSTVLTTTTMSGVTTNSLKGLYLAYTSGAAAGQNELITANTQTTITTSAFSPAPDPSTPDAFTVGCMVLAPNVPQSLIFASSPPSGGSGWEWGSTDPGYCTSPENNCPNGEGVFIVVFYYQSGQISSQVLPFQSETMNEALCSSSSCSISPSPATIDQGQSIVLSAVQSDGVAPYTYTWLQEAPGATSYSPIGGATSQTYTFSTTTSTSTGGWKFEVKVTDADGYYQTSGSDTVTVKTALTAGGITPSPAIVDSGRSVPLQSAPAGGTGSFSYQWYIAPGAGACSPSYSAISGATSSSYSATPGTNTYYCYTVTDTGVTAGSSPPEIALSGTNLVTVNPAFVVPAIKVSPSTIDSGQSATLSTTTSFSGGTPTYTCQWLQKSPGNGYASLGSPFACTAGSTPSISTGPLSTSGTWQFELQVTDSSSNPIYVSNAPALTVNPPVSAGTLSANHNPVDVNQATTISTSGASGGSSSYTTYSWTNLPPGCVSSNSASISCTPTSSSGSPFSVTLTVTDSLAGTGSASMSLTVNPALTVPAPTANHNPADVGQSVTFTESPTGGSTPYSYTWTGLPTGCSTSNSATITCSPSTTTGSPFSVKVAVTDASSNTVTSAALPFTVNSALNVPPPIVNHNPANPGQSVTFTESPTGGSTPYSYTWTGLPTGCSTSNSATITCSPSTAGTYSVQVIVTDANSNTVPSGTLSFKIKGEVQGKVLCSSLTGSPCSSSLSNNVVQGDLIVVVFTSNVNSGTCVVPSGTTPVTDSLGDTFTATTAASGDKTSGSTRACSYDVVYYATAGSSGADTISVAYSGTASSGAVVAYEAVGVTSPSVAGTPDSCNSGSCSGSLSTASFSYSANGFTVAVGAVYGSGITITGAPGAGFTGTVGTGSANYVGYWVPSSSSSSTFSMTKSGSSTTWAELVVEFN